MKTEINAVFEGKTCVSLIINGENYADKAKECVIKCSYPSSVTVITYEEKEADIRKKLSDTLCKVIKEVIKA